MTEKNENINKEVNKTTSAKSSTKAELQDLQKQVEELMQQVGDSPKRVRALEDRLLETKGQLTQALSHNERLTATLRETREHVAALREEVEKLTMPPAAYGVFLEENEDGTVDILSGGRKMRVSVAPSLLTTKLERGQEVVLNEALNIVLVKPIDKQGEIVVLKMVIDSKRVLISARGDEDRICEIVDELANEKLKPGDNLLFDYRTGLIVEKVAKSETQDLILEEVPDVSYDDIGGLDDQIDTIKDAVELPYLYSELFSKHQLEPPKGILLYGPPGCGKTLIAKAIAHSLAERIKEKTKRDDVTAYFMNVKGPELLNKYVGETERQIRQIFERAREKAEDGMPVIVFFDEMDSLFRTRGSGVSSDIESTIVPQLLAEIDGVETLKNVLVIGASNREELIDPAILRPGRLDVKIKIERPDKNSAKDIFKTYLKEELPFGDELLKQFDGNKTEAVADVIEKTVEAMYEESDSTRFLEVTYQNGDKETLYFKDFSSGAMIENIVRRAKKLSIKREISGGSEGIILEDLLASVKQEFKEQEDLPNTTNPDDWARVSGKKGERIVFVRTIIQKGDETEGVKQIDQVVTGQYL